MHTLIVAKKSDASTIHKACKTGPYE